MELRFTNTREEYIEAHSAIHLQGAIGFVGKLLGAALGFIFLFGAMKFLPENARLVRQGHLFFLVGPIGYFLLGLLCIWPLTGRWGLRLLPLWIGNILLETRVVAGEEGIEFSRGMRSRHFNWNQFTHFKETPGAFLLFFSSGAYQMITKRAFSGSQESEFRALISTKHRR